MAKAGTVTLTFCITKKDIGRMAKSLKKVAKDPLDCNEFDADALHYASDLMEEIADNLQYI